VYALNKNLVLQFPTFILVAILGCPVDTFITLLTFNKFYQFWIYSRLIGKLPSIKGILNTSSAHRVYHAVNEVYIDRNYQLLGTLMIWDKLFGTRVEETESCVYGVRKPFHGWNSVRVWFDATPATKQNRQMKLAQDQT